MKICILGGGVIGLSTGLYAKSRNGNLDVTIVAETTTPHTTGDGAAGVWYPAHLGNAADGRTRKWLKDSMDHLEAQSKSSRAAKMGIFPIHMMEFNNRKSQQFEQLFPAFRILEGDELAELYGGGDVVRFGCEFMTFIVQPDKYLPHLLNAFLEAGGEVRLGRRVKNLADFCFAEEGRLFDVVVNCTGVGAHQVANDPTIRPMRGQVVRQKTPWLMSARHRLDEGIVYAIPNEEVTVFGGSADLDEWDTRPSRSLKQRIKTNVGKIIPSLQFENHEEVGSWAGLRPSRPEVRLEKEILMRNGESFEVIHNYGHGGSGITVSWGCAKNVYELLGDRQVSKF